MEKINPMSMLGGDPIEMLKSALPKTVNLKITVAIVADPDEPTKEALAFILRENK